MLHWIKCSLSGSRLQMSYLHWNAKTNQADKKMLSILQGNADSEMRLRQPYLLFCGQCTPEGSSLSAPGSGSKHQMPRSPHGTWNVKKIIISLVICVSKTFFRSKWNPQRAYFYQWNEKYLSESKRLVKQPLQLQSILVRSWGLLHQTVMCRSKAPSRSQRRNCSQPVCPVIMLSRH